MRRRRLFVSQSKGRRAFTEGSLFSRRVISALPDWKQDALRIQKGGACAEKGVPTWKHAASSREPSQKRGFWERNSAKRGQKAHGIPGDLHLFLKTGIIME